MKKVESFSSLPDQLLKTDVPVQTPSGLIVLLRPNDTDASRAKPSSIAEHARVEFMQVVRIGDLSLVTFVFPRPVRNVQFCCSGVLDFNMEDEEREGIKVDDLKQENRMFKCVFVGETVGDIEKTKNYAGTFSSFDKWCSFDEFPVRFFHVSTTSIGALQISEVRWDE